jgi:hypothetical protein
MIKQSKFLKGKFQISPGFFKNGSFSTKISFRLQKYAKYSLTRTFSGKPNTNSEEDWKQKMKHFANLGRYQNQTGTLLLFYPCLYGVLLASPTPLAFTPSNQSPKT